MRVGFSFRPAVSDAAVGTGTQTALTVSHCRLVFLTFFLAHYLILRLKRSHDRGGKSHWQLENDLY